MWLTETVKRTANIRIDVYSSPNCFTVLTWYNRRLCGSMHGAPTTVSDARPSTGRGASVPKNITAWVGQFSGRRVRDDGGRPGWLRDRGSHTWDAVRRTPPWTFEKSYVFKFPKSNYDDNARGRRARLTGGTDVCEVGPPNSRCKLTTYTNILRVICESVIAE